MVVMRLGTDQTGRPVLRKEADDPAGIDRLRHEADVLEAAQHPGVVQLGGVEHTAGGMALVLRWAGSRTAADVRLPVEAAARAAAALAATVADLHALGIRHGAIRPDHVVMTDAGRPVLCGFGSATAAPGGPTTADDVAGIGGVVRALAGPDVELEPIPERRFGRNRSFAGMTRRALLTIADQATADDPERRPPARALAAALAGVAPERPEPPARRRFDPPAPRHAGAADDPPRRARAGAALAAAGVVVVALALGARGGGRSPGVVPVDDAIAPSPTTTAPPGCLPAGTDDGCAEPVEVGGGVVSLNGTRFAVGLEGDVLVLGDWDCDGLRTVAALRPATGEIFVFDGYAAPGEDLVVGARIRVSGAVDLQGADPDGDGCPALIAVGPGGQRLEVPA